MAKTSLMLTGKFKRLVAGLGIPAPYVRGLLDTIWDSAHTKGSPLVGTGEDVEALAEWPGDKGVLYGWLYKVGFIEPVGPGGDEEDRFVLHDYWDHATEYAVDRYRARVSRKLGAEQMTRAQARAHAYQVYSKVLGGQDERDAEVSTPVPGHQPPASLPDPPSPPPTEAEPGGKEKAKRRLSKSPFVDSPPSLEEVTEYIESRGYGQAGRLAESFLDHETLVDWRYGKARVAVVDWKGAVRQYLSGNWFAEKCRTKARPLSVGADASVPSLSSDRAAHPELSDFVFKQYSRDVHAGKCEPGTIDAWLKKREKS